jgi:hypothetical protein
MAQVELTKRTVNKLANNIKTQIQRYKVAASIRTLPKLNKTKDFPAVDEYTAYVTSTNTKNRYEDVSKFWKVMWKAPKYWDKKFIYLSAGNVKARMVEAVDMAIDLAESQTRAYPQPDKKGVMHTTGHLFDSIRTFINRSESQTPVTDIRRSRDPVVFQMANIADYGSTAEAYATYSALNGLLFFAATKVQTKFPDLGVVFAYAGGADYNGSIWDVPVLTIGPADIVSGKWSRPGARIRRRRRFITRQRGRNIGG